MLGKSKIILSAAIILAAAPAAFAQVRTSPTGPEWYVDDQGFWHSIRSDWRNLQRATVSPNRRPRRSHTQDADDR